MNDYLILLSFAFLAVFAVSGVVFAVKKIMKKRTKAGVVSLASLGCGVVCLLWSLSYANLPDTLMIVAVLAALSVVPLLVAVCIRKARKKKRAVHWVCIAAAVAVMIGAYHASNAVWSRRAISAENYEVTVQTEYDFAVEDGDTPLPVVTSFGFDPPTGTYRQVFESSDLPLLLKTTGVTAQDCIDVIRRSKTIDKEYKEYFVDFTQRIAENYPDADLSILYHNLTTLVVTKAERMQLITKSRSADASGCYRLDENAIYIPQGIVFKEGEWGFQVLIHEFCHMARCSWWTDEETGMRNRIMFQTFSTDIPKHNRTILEESMNSAFSCSLMHYYEKDIAYQLPSNYLRIMLECMDNYTLADYINHSDLYFLRQLDAYTGYTNYADVIWRLITLQRYDGQSDSVDIPAEEYRPIYDYICDMYYGKYITADMDAQQRTAVADELVEKAFYDVDPVFKIDKEYFYTYLDAFVPTH